MHYGGGDVKPGSVRDLPLSPLEITKRAINNIFSISKQVKEARLVAVIRLSLISQQIYGGKRGKVA